MSKELVCPTCGNSFLPCRNDQKYCSPECRISYNNIRRSNSRRKNKIYRSSVHYFGGIGMPALDSMSGDDLIHYGKISSKIQIEREKK